MSPRFDRSGVFISLGVIGPATLRSLAWAAPHHIILESPTLKPGQLIPRQHTTQGTNTSPALIWRGLPSNTKQIAVTLEDHDTHFPTDTVFLQWMVYGIPSTAKGLPQGLPIGEIVQAPADIRGAFQALTHFDEPGYRGPQPPVGELHHYRFTVYALDEELVWQPGLFANHVLDAIRPHVVGEGEIAATYQRTP